MLSKNNVIILFICLLIGVNTASARYIESDPIGLEGGLNTYGYAYQNPVKYIDPDGRWAFLVAIPAAIGIKGSTAATATGLLAGGLIVGQLGGSQMAGLQTTRNPVTHSREDEILYGYPRGGCDGLEAAIRDLKRTIKWRKGDLNPAEKGTRNYVGHVQRIKKLQKRLEQLQREARNMGCNPNCE